MKNVANTIDMIKFKSTMTKIKHEKQQDVTDVKN